MTTHGDSKTRLFRIWNGMLNRCTNPNNGGWKNYGGRGVTVCEEWVESYESFKLWAITNGYADELTIDRIDCDGNYEPSNCRWVGLREQARNKRNNARLPDGRMVYEVAKVSPSQVRKRVYRGMTVENAALTAPQRVRAMLPDGSFASDVARANGISIGTFNRRLEYGWDVVRAATEKPRHWGRG